jgi:hypothetical protein
MRLAFTHEEFWDRLEMVIHRLVLGRLRDDGCIGHAVSSRDAALSHGDVP